MDNRCNTTAEPLTFKFAPSFFYIAGPYVRISRRCLETRTWTLQPQASTQLLVSHHQLNHKFSMTQQQTLRLLILHR